MSFKASQGISELNKNSIIDRVCLNFLGSLSVWENLGNMIFLGFTQGVPWIKSLFRDDADLELAQDLSAICTFLHIDYNSFLENATPFKQWGKLKLASKYVLGSQLSTKKGRLSRRSEWFEVSLSL